MKSLDTEAVLGGGYSPYAAANAPAEDLRAQLADLAAEVERQDRFHPSGYPATRDGVFLGIKTAVHELDREAVDAWSDDRCKCVTSLCGHADWRNTRGELLQVAAVIMRTIRSIDAHRPTPRQHIVTITDAEDPYGLGLATAMWSCTCGAGSEHPIAPPTAERRRSEHLAEVAELSA